MNSTLELRIAELDCADEAQQIESALTRLDGVGEVRAAVGSRTAVVTYDPQRVQPEAIRQAVTNLGMTVTERRPGEAPRRRALRSMRRLAVASGRCRTRTLRPGSGVGCLRGRPQGR